MSDLVLSSVERGIARVTLNRPDRLNAFADDMRERLADALDAIAARGDVRVLAIAGAGRAFSAGGDVRHMAALREQGAGFEAIEPLLEAGRRVVTRLVDMPIPTVALVHGPAAGAGLHLALACDLRLASDAATFGATFVRIGLHPDWGGTWLLPRLVGVAKALELCWLGEPVDAAEALRIGLVNRVVPADRFVAEADALLARLADAPATSVRAAKRTLHAATARALASCLDAEIEAQRACWASDDVTEGLRAFVEKRAPRFGAAVAPAAAARSFESPRAL